MGGVTDVRFSDRHLLLQREAAAFLLLLLAEDVTWSPAPSEVEQHQQFRCEPGGGAAGQTDHRTMEGL